MTLALACYLALSPGFAKPATIEEIAKQNVRNWAREQDEPNCPSRTSQ